MIERAQDMCHSTKAFSPLKRGPKSKSGQARQFTVSLEPLTYERVRALASQKGVPVGAVVRGLLERGLANV